MAEAEQTVRHSASRAGKGRSRLAAAGAHPRPRGGPTLKTKRKGSGRSATAARPNGKAFPEIAGFLEVTRAWADEQLEDNLNISDVHEPLFHLLKGRVFHELCKGMPESAEVLRSAQGRAWHGAGGPFPAPPPETACSVCSMPATIGGICEEISDSTLKGPLWSCSSEPCRFALAFGCAWQRLADSHLAAGRQAEAEVAGSIALSVGVQSFEGSEFQQVVLAQKQRERPTARTKGASKGKGKTQTQQPDRKSVV